jgi:hypothetical protein
MAHCTNCGTEVSADAKFCPNCGQATGASVASPGKDKVQPSHKGKGCMAAFAIVLVLFVLAVFAGSGNKTASTPSNSPSAADKPVRTVSAEELWNAYQDNEASAQQTYGGIALAVKGTVDGVDLDFADNPVVKLKAPNQYMPVQADLADEAKPRAVTLVKGMPITLRCDNVSEVLGTPMLKDCTF